MSPCRLGEGDDPHASVFATLYPANQALCMEAVHGDTDRTWRQIEIGPIALLGRGPLV